MRLPRFRRKVDGLGLALIACVGLAAWLAEAVLYLIWLYLL